MRKILKGSALFLAASALALAQNPTCNSATIPICTSAQGAGAVQIKPQNVPTSSTIVAATDAYLKVITVSNNTANALTFTLSDRQGTPIAAIPTVSVAANTAYIISWPDDRLYWCPGGFTVIASDVGLTFHGAFKQ